LFGDFVIVATLQQQFDNLPLSRTQRFFLHYKPLKWNMTRRRIGHGKRSLQARFKQLKEILCTFGAKQY